MIVTWAFTFLFVCLAGYITHYAITHRQELINNSYNGRQQMLIDQNLRCLIYAADGNMLSLTVENEDG